MKKILPVYLEHSKEILALTDNLSNVRYLLQSLFLISAEPDSKKIPGNNIQIAISFSHCKT